MPSSHRIRALAIALPVALLAGCAGTSQPPAGEATAPTATAGDTAPSPTGALATKPAVTVPDGDPPSELQIRDIVEGTGPAAEPGQTVSVQYVGLAWSTKKEFDSSWDRGGTPVEFPIGVGYVIAGWDQGVPGMKVGGRRELVIPPELGYGEEGSPPDIGPNETLVFVIDLVALP